MGLSSDVPEAADNRAAFAARFQASAVEAGVVTPVVAAPAPAPSAEPAPAEPALEAAPASPELAAPAAEPVYQTEVQPQPVAPAEPTLASLMAEIQALKAAATAAPAPGTPLATVQPAAPEPAPVPPAEHEVHAYAQQQAAQVSGIPEIVAQYRAVNAAIGREDGRGGWIPGTLGVAETIHGLVVPDLDRRIMTLQEQLDPERARAARLPVIDELTRDDYRRAVSDLEQQRRERIYTFEAGQKQAQRLSNQYERVYQHYRAQATAGYQQAVGEREHAATIDRTTVEVKTLWDGEFNRVLTEFKVDPANKPLVDRIWNQVKLHGLVARNEDVAPEVLNSWMKTVVGGELGWVDKSHRLQAGEYGKNKLQAAGAAVAAPRAGGLGSTATAPQTVSWQGDKNMTNRERLRASFGTRRTA